MCDDGAPIWVKCRPRREDQVKNSAILLLKCPDRKGLDAAIADFIYWHGGGNLHFDLNPAGEEEVFFFRGELEPTPFLIHLKEFPQVVNAIMGQNSNSMPLQHF